jgi:hypothetical protein
MENVCEHNIEQNILIKTEEVTDEYRKLRN